MINNYYNMNYGQTEMDIEIYDQVYNLVDNTMLMFIKRASEDLNIDQTKLLEIWEREAKNVSKKKVIKKKNEVGGLAVTVTYSECVENHVGMQQIGVIEKDGFSVDDLEQAMIRFEKEGAKCELIDLNMALENSKHKGKGDDAKILIIRDGVDIILNKYGKTKNDMFKELLDFEWDKKAIMRKKLVNKRARENVCFSDEKQDADIINGKGTVIEFNRVECTKIIREQLGVFVGDKANMLYAEGNKYNNVNSNGIGFHGDSERAKVIAVRLGKTFPLHYQWFLRSKPIGDRVEILLNDGDMYVMSSKAVGKDWKFRSKYTLRHAAGASKYLEIKDK
jgi:hypothetical protein